MSKTNVATNSEPGIIGQMYEDRKSKKRGVLESRETKYKTLMFRADDGSSFNITYATFRSNWRKYVGDEIIQTSTQVEEQKTEEKKREQTAKKTVESKSEVVKMTTEEKVKKVRAIDELVISKIKNIGTDLIKTTRTSRGCVIVQYKKKTLFEIWTKFGLDKFDICVLDDVAASDEKKFKAIIAKTDYTNKEKWHLPHLFRIGVDAFDGKVDALLELANNYASAKAEATKKKEEK